LPLRRYPSVTEIRPIKGLDAGARENLEAAFAVDYPGEVELLFVFDDEQEPAVPLVREAIERHAGREEAPGARILFSGPPPPRFTGKLNAMRYGYEHASGEVVAFADSDIRPAPHTLRRLVETLQSDSRVGAAFAPAIAASPSRTLGDSAYSLLLNGMYGPSAATLARLRDGELPFIMGQYMALRREAIEAMGGFEATAGQLVDDMYIGARLNAVGYRNRVAPVKVPIIQEGIGLREFIKLYHKWMTFSRSGLTQRSFRAVTYLPGVLFFGGLVLVGAALLVAGAHGAAAAGLAASLIVATSVNTLHATIGGAPLPWRHRWVSFVLMLTAPLVLLSTRVVKTVDWRGRSYEVNDEARIATEGGGDGEPGEREPGETQPGEREPGETQPGDSERGETQRGGRGEHGERDTPRRSPNRQEARAAK
jgi:ceramide glucosyltransferase